MVALLARVLTKIPGRLFLAASTFFRLFSGLAVLLMMARYLPPAEVGIAAIGLSAGAVLSTVQDWGQTNVILREVGRSPSDARSITTSSLSLRLALSLATLPVAVAVMPFFGDHALALLMIVFAGSIAGHSEMTIVPNRALGKYVREFFAVTLTCTLYVVLPGLACVIGGRIETVAAALLTARILQLFIFSLASRQYVDAKAITSFKQAPSMFRRGLGFAMEAILVNVTSQLDTIVLAGMLSLEQMGAYQAGARFAQSISPLATIISVSNIPKLAAAIKNSDSKEAMRSVVVEFSVASLAVLLAFLVGGPLISRFVYVQKFPELRYLWPALGVYSMLRMGAAPFNVYFISAGAAREAAWMRFFFAVSLVTCIMVAVPIGQVSAVGPALCCAATMHLLLGGYFYFRRTRLVAVSLGIPMLFIALGSIIIWQVK